jgi:hypothetical protein
MILTLGVDNFSHLLLINNMQRVDNYWAKNIYQNIPYEINFLVGNIFNLPLMNQLLRVDNF